MKPKTTLTGPAFALAVAFCGVLAPAASVFAAQAAPAAKRQPDVTMYVMPQCGYCEKARQHLKQAGVVWRERDISDPAINAEFRAKGGTGTPLIVIGKRVINGWRPDAVDAALAAAPAP